MSLNMLDQLLPGYRFEYLSPKHEEAIKNFDCSDEVVNRFLREEAIDLMNKNLVRTQLLFDNEGVVVGFYSLFNDTIKMKKEKRDQLGIILPSSSQGRRSKYTGPKEIPCIKLFYLGVDYKHRYKKIGSALIAIILYNCAEIAKTSGCALVRVDAIKSVREFYEKNDFTYIGHTEGGNYYNMAIALSPFIELYQDIEKKYQEGKVE